MGNATIKPGVWSQQLLFSQLNNKLMPTTFIQGEILRFKNLNMLYCPEKDATNKIACFRH